MYVAIVGLEGVPDYSGSGSGVTRVGLSPRGKEGEREGEMMRKMSPLPGRGLVIME